MSAATGDATLPGLPWESRLIALHPAILGIFSGVLLILAFPPLEWFWMAWIALIPLCILVITPRRIKAQTSADAPASCMPARTLFSLYAGAWAGGLIFWLTMVQWIRHADPGAWPGMLGLAIYLSFWWPLFVGVARIAVHRFRWPLAVAAPVVWIGLEQLRGTLLTGFPWFHLSHSQFTVTPLIQIADLGGALTVSLVIMSVNATLTLWLRAGSDGTRGRWPLPRELTISTAVAVGIVVLSIAYGFIRIQTAQFKPGPQIALLQSDLPQGYDSALREPPESVLQKYEQMMITAARNTPKPDLIVWPETSYPYGLAVIDPTLDDTALEKQIALIPSKDSPAAWRESAKSVDGYMRDWCNELKIPILYGVSKLNFTAKGFSKRNGAVLFTPGAAGFQDYEKLHLVAFGEYVPLLDTIPWLMMLTPFQGTRIPNMTPGENPRWLQCGPWTFAAVICFEDTVTDVVDRVCRESPKNVDVIVNQSNDGWFRNTPEHRSHLAGSVFRAVEHRTPMVRAVNTGISAVIDGNGTIVEQLPYAQAGVINRNVPLDPRSSIYHWTGNWLGPIGGFVVLALLLGQMLTRGRQR